MTITLTKTRVALAILVAVLVVPATALADHVFDDVPDDAFYAEPVDWAFTNNITTGKSPTSFAPLDNVTRGESVTFLQRYNDNIVEPATTANAAAAAAAAAAADSNTTDIAALETATYTQTEVDAAVASARPRFATVTEAGTLLEGRSRGVDSITKDGGSGTYRVFFEEDISECVFLATPSDLGQAPENVQVGIQGAPIAGNGVFIQAADNDDNLVDSGFFLAILC